MPTLWVARRRQKNSRRTRQSPQFFNGQHDRVHAKKHEQVLTAFEQLWAREIDPNLVIVGKQGRKVEALVERLRTHPELGKRLFWLEGISDEYLDKIYAAKRLPHCGIGR